VPLVHAGYHKIASVWFENVLSDVAGRYGLTFSSTYLPFIKRDPVFRLRQPAPEVGPPTWIGDVNLFMHSRNFSDELFAGRPIRGTHIVRDPRDVAVSGYRYHLWTDEEWVHTPYEGSAAGRIRRRCVRCPNPKGCSLK